MMTKRVGTADAWDRFVRVAAYVRGHPRFESEERARKLRLASSVRELIAEAERGTRFRPRLDELLVELRDPGWPCRLLLPVHGSWLEAWASSDEASLRRAIAVFSRFREDPLELLAAFVREMDEAATRGAVAARSRCALLFGSLFNYAADPESLPLVYPAAFERLEEKLGWHGPGGDGVVEQYERHLEFGREAEVRLRAAEVPVEDMVDVHSLILMASAREEFWAVDPPRFEPPHVGGTAITGTGRRPTIPYLAIGACAGYEAPYLREWIEFHRLVGVEHFFLYNNGDREAQRNLLAPYVEEGVVTLYDWRAFPPQVPAYRHCVREHGSGSRWIAFIDCDEFLFSPTGRPLPEVLGDYEGYAGVGVNWVMFGPSGHVSKPSGLVTESYVLKALDSGLGTYGANHIKTIVDPRRAVDCASPHHFIYDHEFAVDENLYPVLGSATAYVSTSRLRINHYFTHSVNEFRAKLARARADTGALRPESDIEQLLVDEQLYGVRDESIQIYLPELRKAVTAASASG